ncbi:MAG: metal-sensing transcriptional repressor [Selenomonadaceae bacterium]|nr:metal-sensing transcriptional repressor [Selenomonadaceae bacterium]
MNKENQMHEHKLEDGTIIRHNHSHTHKQTKAVLNRMARLIGHLESTKKMIEDGRDCSEVLTQIAAVDAALRAVARIILKDHIEHCIVEAIQEGDQKTIDDLNQAIDQFLK